MKKLVLLMLAGVMTALSCVNCFAYVKTGDCILPHAITEYGLPSSLLYMDLNSNQVAEYERKNPGGIYGTIYASNDAPEHIVTNEYKMVNGTAMVKFRDMINVYNGKIEFNSSNKSVKVYFNNSYDTRKSISVTAGSDTIYASYNDYNNAMVKSDASFKTSVPPVIIDGSLYISAIDLGKIMAPYWNFKSSYSNDAEKYKNEYAGIKNGVLYILTHANTQ